MMDGIRKDQKNHGKEGNVHIYGTILISDLD